ncbi:MAG TPA: TRIC cation channel family protein, partial [Candidatus Limnocylindria bacterium]|nr:TRIC cation channel family protein [Candidatus Limnocylindria bacterium]
GIVRDVLSGTVPTVLRADIYAVAAAVGALALVLALRAGQPLEVSAVGGAAVTTALRLAAIRYGWQAPRQRETPAGS